METWLRHLHLRDLRFIAFVPDNLVCLAGYLLAHVQTMDQETGGWRRIDLEAVMTRIEAGDLLRHEAAWYHTKQEVGRKPVGGELLVCCPGPPNLSVHRPDHNILNR